MEKVRGMASAVTSAGSASVIIAPVDILEVLGLEQHRDKDQLRRGGIGRQWRRPAAPGTGRPGTAWPTVTADPGSRCMPAGAGGVFDIGGDRRGPQQLRPPPVPPASVTSALRAFRSFPFSISPAWWPTAGQGARGIEQVEEEKTRITSAKAFSGKAAVAVAGMWRWATARRRRQVGRRLQSGGHRQRRGGQDADQHRAGDLAPTAPQSPARPKAR